MLKKKAIIMNTENNIFDGCSEKKLVFENDYYHKLRQNLIRTKPSKGLKLMNNFSKKPFL